MTSPSSNAFLVMSRIFAIATLVVVFVSFGTAGVLVQKGEAEDVHGYAAIALHIVTAGLLVSLAGFVYERRRHWWTVVVAALLLMYTFIQAQLGDSGRLDLHIPGALLVAVASVWLTAWLFVRRDVSGDLSQTA